MAQPIEMGSCVGVILAVHLEKAIRGTMLVAYNCFIGLTKIIII